MKRIAQIVALVVLAQPVLGGAAGIVAGWFLHDACGTDYACVAATFAGWLGG